MSEGVMKVWKPVMHATRDYDYDYDLLKIQYKTDIFGSVMQIIITSQLKGSESYAHRKFLEA